MRAIDEHFALWLARVEELVGHKVDPVQAHLAFACLEPPYKALTPEEYAAEFKNDK
jgi:hypothetical protein